MARGDREELIVWDDEQGIKLPSLKDASRRYGGRKDIAFTEDQIAEILLTHDKWNFNAER